MTRVLTACAVLAGAATARYGASPDGYEHGERGVWTYPPHLSNCTMQSKIRSLSPLPISVVWLEREGESMADIMTDFQAIRGAGFTALKQLIFRTDVAMDPTAAQQKQMDVFNAALDAGLIPWWYEVGGWECVTQDLLTQLGIPLDTPMPAIQVDPRMTAYQTQVLRARIANMFNVTQYIGLGEPGRGSPLIQPQFVPMFAQWLNVTYGGNITQLQVAWQYPYRNLSSTEFTSFTTAAALVTTAVAGETCPWTYCAFGVSWDFLRYRDSMRFQADLLAMDQGNQMDLYLAHDPQEPQRVGISMAMDNQAQNGWDPASTAALAARGGSMYLSLHMPWHYTLMNGEMDRPAYFQVRVVTDSVRMQAWPGIWESSGGPAQYSGGQAGTLDAGQITRLFMHYLAAGMKGIGLWCWNGRQLGQEAMEYQLVTLQNKPGPRALAAGAIAAALQVYRWELWNAVDEPLVAVLYSWENEAIFGRLALTGPPLSCSISACADFTTAMAWNNVKGRMGIVRALMNKHVAWQFVNENDVRSGALAALGVRVLVLPHMLGMSTDLLDIISAFAASGGRVVADQPFMLYDNRSHTIDHTQTPIAALFGAYVQNFENTWNGYNRSVNGIAVSGQYGDMAVTTATVTATFDNGEPAILTNRFGVNGGSAALLNFEATRMNWAAGTLGLDDLIVGTVLDSGAIGLPWTATVSGFNGGVETPVMVHRRTALYDNATVDHYFLVNDQAVAQNVTISLAEAGFSYATGQNAVTGTPVALDAAGRSFWVMVQQRTGAWVRVVRSA